MSVKKPRRCQELITDHLSSTKFKVDYSEVGFLEDNMIEFIHFVHFKAYCLYEVRKIE